MLGKGYRLGGSVGTVLQEVIRKSGKEAPRTPKIGVTFPCKFSKPKGQEDNFTRNLLPGKTLLNKVGSISKSLASQGIQNPKPKANLEQDQKALVRINPKRRRGKRSPKRSTAGNIEQPLDDNGICMKNLFGSQLFPGNSNYQILKALVPEGNLQKDSKLEWPLSFSMRPALPPPDLQSNTSSIKAVGFTKKKGLRRGKKAFPCETSTQTIEEESDPVLSCLEQIRNQLAGKTPENQEKKISRCFAEKSTNVRSIQGDRNEAGVEEPTQSSPNEAIEAVKDDKSDNSKPSDPQQTTSSGSFQKRSPRNSLNILAQPKSKTNNMVKKSTSSKTQSNLNAVSSPVSTGTPKKSQEKVETNLNREDGDLKKPKDTVEGTGFVNVTKPILKPCICLCRLPRVFPKFTRVMMPITTCQHNFMNGCRMPKWQNHSQPNQHCCQCIHTQGNQKRIPPTTASMKDVPYEQEQSEKRNHSNSRSCLSNCEKPMSTGQRSIMKRKSGKPNQRFGCRTSNRNICFRERISTFSQSTQIEYPTKECAQYHCNESYASSRTDTDGDYVDGSSNSDFRSSNSVKSKSSPHSTSVRSGSNSSYTAPSANPSEKESYSEGSKSEGPKESSPETKSNISSNESLSSSRKTSRASSIKSNSKTSTRNEVNRFKNKNNELPQNKTGNKRKQRLRKRISSGGETFPEGSIDCGHDEFSEEADAQTPKTSKNSFEALKASENKCGTDIKESKLSKNSDHLLSERNTRKASSGKQSQEQKADSSKESICSRNSDQRNNFECYPNGAAHTKDQCNGHREVSFRQRSQSAPECWILRFPQGNPTNRSKKSHQYSPENCTESQSCPENVLVLQDETGESDSDDCALVRCNDFSTENETLNANCLECETPDYSINASILNQLRKEESSISPTPSQRTFILAGDQHTNDLNTPQQDQEREKPPMVQVPFRMSSTEELGISQPKQWRELGLKLTMLNANQFQMAPATTNHVSLPTKLPKRPNNQNPNSYCGPINGVFVLASSLPTRTNAVEESAERRNRNLQNINQSGTLDSLSSDYPTSRRNISSENRANAPAQTSYAALRGIRKNDSNNSNSERFISVSSQHPELSQDESRNCYRKSDYRSDQSHQESQQEEAIAGVSGYSEMQSMPTVLTWTDPAPNSQLVASNRSNATERSTDVETLETVTLMQPRKLRSCESAGIRNQANRNENTVLMETRTPCNRENLLHTCGRPPCNSCPHHYTGLPPGLHQGFMKPEDHMLQPQISASAPQNITPFDEGYLIDPRDQWMTNKSPASAPAMQSAFQMKAPYQPKPRPHHHFQEPVHPPQSSFQPRNSDHYPELKENIRMLPDGFYDRTVNKYNIARMDSNFQPPEFSLEPEFLHAEQHPTFRQQAGPYGNQFHPQLMMASVPDPNRRYIPPQNQYPAEMQNQLSMYWTQQNINLGYYDQSEYQI
ncbi:uncharacterized protein LOC6545168 isoform X2 [Drosophila erecta]|uniref:uncharacterized protein LOC6545168 isoform X2 n=1 Tax=Drosophila erecta TaxID=7220 RepID=UPI000F06D48E|nr:uncharacterized protein LOC6545168 isoform X2 [Drosophila erecta]